MSGDIRGYYAALDVSHSASATDIKLAYRRLAKLHHPDTGGHRDDAAIKKINEAYSVLKDPERRAAYDGESITSQAAEPSQTREVPPLRCSKCNKITAQPRYLIFWRVYSLIFATVRTPVQGLFCATCAKREALHSTTITALFGWWGVPWGPIWTLVNGTQDALGGEHQKSRSEALTWYNVLAFLQARQVPIAYGLAEKLLRAEDQKIRTAAIDFTASCRSNGYTPKGELADPWLAMRTQAPLRLAILAALPILLGGWIFVASQSSRTTDVTPYAQNYAPEALPTDAAVNVPAAAVVTPAPKDLGPPCALAPANGKILSGAGHLAEEGHRIEIDNGSTGDAIVKVRNAYTGKVYASFFVKKGSSASLSGIQDGEYRVQYAIGDILAKNCKSFLGNPDVSEFPQAETFSKQYIDDYRGEGYEYSRLSYTLYSVPGGNVHPTTISASDFDSD